MIFLCNFSRSGCCIPLRPGICLPGDICGDGPCGGGDLGDEADVSGDNSYADSGDCIDDGMVDIN